MSIYATLWTLQFPKHGDDYVGCEWTQVMAQGVPAHIGSPTTGCGYEAGDPYSAFLPPSMETDENGDADSLRAVVFVTQGTPKGTLRSPQEYPHPLLVLTGSAYATISFENLHRRICQALRGDRSRIVAQYFGPKGEVRILFEDGTIKEDTADA